MRKGELSREEVINIVGENLVDKLESENCDYTNRLQTDGDDAVEFSASVKFTDFEGELRTLVAYYYQDPEKLDGCEDMGELDWEINGYEIL